MDRTLSFEPSVDYTLFLRSCGILRDVPDAELAALAARLRPRSAQRGEYVFRRGAPSEAMYLVVAGRVRLVGADAEGHDYVLACHEASGCFGEVALLGGVPHAADAEALEDSLLLELRHADFDEWVMAHPLILTSMLRALGERSAAPDSPRAAPPESVDSAPAPVTREQPAPADPARGTVVLVCGPRGGSGRSTIAVNLAVALALQYPEQVGLLDLSQTYGQAALLLNLQPSASVASLPGELLAAPDGDALERYFAVHPSSLRLLAGALQPDELAALASARLDALLDCLARRLAYLVIDTSSVFDDLVLAVTARADQVVLVLTPELAAIHGAREWRRVYAGRLGLAADRLRCVLNHPHASAALARPDLEQILGCAMDAEVPYGGPVVARAALRGEPFVLTDPRGPAARACDRLARTLAGLPVPLDPPAEEPLPLRLRRGARTLLARGR